MKVGDLVVLKSEKRLIDIYYGYGVIILIKEYGKSGMWYQVQWARDNMWHTADDLILVNE